MRGYDLRTKKNWFQDQVISLKDGLLVILRIFPILRKPLNKFEVQRRKVCAFKCFPFFIYLELWKCRKLTETVVNKLCDKSQSSWTVELLQFLI